MSTETTAMVPYDIEQSVGMVVPLVHPTAAAAAIRQYEALKAAIVQDSDVQIIQGRKFLKKAFWRRVATCFGLSLEMVSERRELDAEGKLAYSAIYKAIAPNGRSMTADGYCSRGEKGRESWPEHSVRATAHTRAKNRAISDLVGGGEVSAEEIDEDETPAPRQQPAPRTLPQRTVSADPTPASAQPPKKSTDLRLLGNKLGWSVQEYANYAAQFLDKSTGFTNEDRDRWESHLRDLIEQKRQVEAATAPDPKAPRKIVREPPVPKTTAVKEFSEVLAGLPVEPSDDETLTSDEEAPFGLRGEQGA